MGFLIFCVLLWALLVNGVKPDTYGWLMLCGLGWFLGFVDAQVFRRWEQQQRSPLPEADENELF
jgi:hypothetical protein